MNASILIPAYDNKKDSDKYLELLLNSIEQQGIHEVFNIRVAFDGVREKFLDYFISKYPFIQWDEKLINFGNPYNFCRNVNQGLRFLHGELGQSVLVVNQDTILPRLPYLLELTKEPALVSAEEVVLSSEIPVGELYGVCKAFTEKLIDAQAPESLLTRVDAIKGFCFYIDKEVMDRVGYLNEYMKALFDDDDLCARANLEGIPIYSSNIKVQHFKSKIGKHDGRQLDIRKNQFHILWNIPLNIAHKDFQTHIKENYEPVKES